MTRWKKFLTAAARTLVFGLTLAVLAAGASGQAWGAMIFGPSNFDMFGYPKPKCYAPSPPYSDDDWAWTNFKSEVESYRMCIERYVEAADNDIRLIREQANEAVQEYNYFIRTLQ